MKETIIEQIRKLTDSKIKAKVEPHLPNELEIKRQIQEMTDVVINELIETGEVIVIGNTVNKHRIVGLFE